MKIKDTIKNFEKRRKALKVDISDLCDQAKLTRGTWYTLGKNPRLSTILAIDDALTKLELGKAKK